MSTWERDSVSVETLRATAAVTREGGWRVHIETYPDRVFVALFDLTVPMVGGQQVWAHTLRRPPGTTLSQTLDAALRSLLTAHARM